MAAGAANLLLHVWLHLRLPCRWRRCMRSDAHDGGRRDDMLMCERHGRGDAVEQLDELSGRTCPGRTPTRQSRGAASPPSGEQPKIRTSRTRERGVCCCVPPFQVFVPARDGPCVVRSAALKRFATSRRPWSCSRPERPRRSSCSVQQQCRCVSVWSLYVARCLRVVCVEFGCASLLSFLLLLLFLLLFSSAPPLRSDSVGRRVSPGSERKTTGRTKVDSNSTARESKQRPDQQGGTTTANGTGRPHSGDHARRQSEDTHSDTVHTEQPRMLTALDARSSQPLLPLYSPIRLKRE